MPRVRVPNYFTEFKCIGSDCPDDCCYGWRVNVDQSAYEHWNTVARDINGRQVDEALRLLPEKERSNRRWAVIEMNQENRCPFHQQDGLCAIHARLGERYLPQVCATYPRRVAITFHRHEVSLSLSCPESARLALCSPLPLSFIDMSIEEDRDAVIQSRLGNISTEPIGRSYQAIQDTAIRLLQARMISIDERLVVLGLLTLQLEEIQKEGDATKLSALLLKFSKIDKFASLGDKFKNMKTNPTITVAIASELIAISRNEGFRLPAFHELVEILTGELGIEESASLDTVSKRYQEIKKRHLRPFLDAHGRIMERYLINRLFQLSFPFAARFKPFELYVQIVVKYTIIKMLILGVASKEGEVTGERAIRIVQLVAKVVEHSPKCIGSIESFFEENDFLHLGHMATLLIG